MEKMDSNQKIPEMKDRKVILSTLWILLMFNWLYCDVITNMDSVILKELMTGFIEGIQVTQYFLLGSALLMEIPIAMIVLSRVLKYRVNRLANIIAGTIMTVVQISSLFVGPPTLHYIFYSAIEIACTSLIVWYAWKWSNPEGSNNKI